MKYLNIIYVFLKDLLRREYSQIAIKDVPKNLIKETKKRKIRKKIVGVLNRYSFIFFHDVTNSSYITIIYLLYNYLIFGEVLIFIN